ncbi:hypothetical protein E4U28_007914 [Claviceps purpurea]|nr:hypothetical protein E4U28_007914 [Claviceps purpurea]
MASPPMDFPTRTPKDPMPVDPRTILAALVHLDHKAIPAMMAPSDPRQSRIDIDYEDRRFQRCQETLIKAYTENDKYTGASDEFLMPKITLFNAAKGLAPHRATGRKSPK